MAPERIELTSGLGVEGPAPVSTAQGLHGQSTTSSGERSSGEEKRQRRHNRPPRPMPPVDESPADLSKLSSEQALDQDRESEPKSEWQQDQEQNDVGSPHRIDSLA
jgi:hypothetical protein